MKTLNWNEKARYAKGLKNVELRFALKDCLDSINVGVCDEGYYYDEASVYRTELAKRKKYVAYNDAGHGWLKVTRAELVKAGVEKEITSSSYQRGNNVYLEEDGDAPLFQRAVGIDRNDIVDKHTNKQSKIRNYESYNPNVMAYVSENATRQEKKKEVCDECNDKRV